MGARRQDLSPEAIGNMGRHLIGRQTRSSHMCYDCYLSGPTEGLGGRTRMILRPTRIPTSIDDRIAPLLPIEMQWPQPDHISAHGCVDAVLTCDTASMRAWMDAWPEHEFGFEQFLIWAQRLRRGGRGPLDRNKRGAQALVKASHLVAVDARGAYQVRTEIIVFDDESSALRISVEGPLGDGEYILLSSAYVDSVTSRYEVVEHHPGRYQALGIHPATIYAVLKVPAPDRLPGRLTIANAPAPKQPTALESGPQTFPAARTRLR